jgi:sulfur carrier protein
MGKKAASMRRIWRPWWLALALNLQIVPRSLYAATALADGDRIEIVQFVGGG